MLKVALIDVGSNSIHMVVARIDDAPRQRHLSAVGVAR